MCKMEDRPPETEAVPLKKAIPRPVEYMAGTMHYPMQ